MPLQWGDPLPFVWEGGPKLGHSHQSPPDGALWAWPCMQELFQLPIHLIRNHLLPWPEGLPTLRGGGPNESSSSA